MFRFVSTFLFPLLEVLVGANRDYENVIGVIDINKIVPHILT